jgi:glycosyltransferase involved in cell wall biosynthesis
MPTLVSVFGVEPNRIGGTETFARELSLQLAERGWKSVLCFETMPPPDVADFLSLPNVTLEVLKAPTNLNWAATKDLASILRKHKADILHLHFVGFVGIYPWLARLLSVKKIFFTDHSSRPSGYTPQRAPWWKRKLVRMINYPITKVICVSKFGYKCITGLDVLPRERFELVYNGVDTSRVTHSQERAAEFRRRFGIPANKKLVVQISWIIPEKGIPDLLEVARLVTSRRNDVQFVIVGEGPFRDEYTRKAEQLGLKESVTWTGLVKDPFGEGVFDAADVVCQLSNWEEVFGWMIAEAMAFGKPVVGTNVGGIPELIEQDQNGYRIKIGDFQLTAERLLELLENPALREQMGKAGASSVQSRFNLKTNVTQLIEVYGE